MPRGSNLGPEDFDRLLKWLDPDRDKAAEKYQDIHRKLTRLFAFKLCECPEELADEVIDRVARSVDNFRVADPDDHIKVFYAFHRYVYLEYCREHWRSESLDSIVSPVAPITADDAEKQQRCLDKCMGQLAEADSFLVRRYYEYPVGQKIPFRLVMAQQMQTTMNGLRIRVCRIRSALKGCIERCFRSNDSNLVQ
jgi:hypothetical protein